MSINFTRDNIAYELGLDGSVRADGNSFGRWTTNSDNALEVTADEGGSVFAQPAKWSTKNNRLSVTPDGGAAVDFLDATEGNIQFRLKNNLLVVDPLPVDDEFSFTLSGDWAMADDLSSLQLKVGDRTLVFEGGLKDSQSRFVWSFTAENANIKKLFALRFDGSWRMKKRPDGKAGVLAVFAFEYTLAGQTTKDTFEMPVEVTADSANGNRLLFSYKRAGSTTQWGVAFAGRFTTKGGSIIGYSAEVYDDNGIISSRFAFDFKGKIKNGSAATRNTLKFEVAIAGAKIDLTLSGKFNFTKSSLSFSLQLNTASKTGQISAITFGIQFAKTNGASVDLNIKVDGSSVTISLAVGTDVVLGGSRKGSVYAKLDMTFKGDTVGIDALFGITLN